MVDIHSVAFFGKNVGLKVSSSSRSTPDVYIQCIRKKRDGSWEKPSMKEGKNVKFNLRELIQMIDVLNGTKSKWTTVHKFGNNNTSITFAWDQNESDLLWVNIADYSRAFNYPDPELLRKLLEHLLDEKIEYGTGFIPKTQTTPSTSNQNAQVQSQTSYAAPSTNYDLPKQADYVNQPTKPSGDEGEYLKVTAKIKMDRLKALLLEFQDSTEKWFPKSTVEETYNASDNNFQTFSIQQWVLEKNGIRT